MPKGMALESEDHVAMTSVRGPPWPTNAWADWTSGKTEAGDRSWRQRDRNPDKVLHLNFQVLCPGQLDFVQLSMAVRVPHKNPCSPDTRVNLNPLVLIMQVLSAR